MKYIVVLLSLIALFSCSREENKVSYSEVKRLLAKHTDVIELEDKSGKGRILIAPEFQGRIITSTLGGKKGESLGWFNFEALQSNDLLNGSELHAEERVWVGPLGGPLSFYYGQKKPLSEDNWSVPKTFNAEPYELTFEKEDFLVMTKELVLENYLGNTLFARLQRSIEIQSRDQVSIKFKMEVPKNVDMVAYHTQHTLTNLDTVAWRKETGLATLWSLSSFQGSEAGYVVIPIKKKSNQIWNYLSDIELDRKVVTNDAVWYKTDGKYRNKLGVPSYLSTGIFGSYHPDENLLRIIEFNMEGDTLYFHSDLSEEPQWGKGEAIAIYNHGPMDLTKGSENTFYEMESMAGLRELLPGTSLLHAHKVYQFKGDEKELFTIAKTVLGVDLSLCPLQ